MRAVALLMMLLTGIPAFSQAPPCPGLDPGYTLYFGTGTVQYAAFNLTTGAAVFTMRQSPPNNRIFQNVPSSVAQRMSSLNDATVYFNQNIVPVYREALLTTLASGMCPILTQNNTWILTH